MRLYLANRDDDENKAAVYLVAEVRSDGAERCEVADFLVRLGEARAKGFSELFDRYAKGRSSLLSREHFHSAGDDEGCIYRFRKGNYRIYCFLDGGDVVLLTHGVKKKSNKTDPRDIRKAQRLRKQYIESKERGELSR